MTSVTAQISRTVVARMIALAVRILVLIIVMTLALEQRRVSLIANVKTIA